MKIIEKRPNGSKRVYTKLTEPSKTDQSFKEMVDVNNIITRYRKTGQISHLRKNVGVFADVSKVPDLLTATVLVKDAQEAFMQLPSDIRQNFDNDPIKFFNYYHDEKNTEKLIEMGLIPKPEQQVAQSNSSSIKKASKAQTTNDDDLNDDDSKQA